LENLMNKLLGSYSKTELLQVCRTLNKEYNIYDPDSLRWDKISYALFKTSIEDINCLKQSFFSNSFVNEIIFNYYHCERVIKYQFIKFLKENNNHIVAFEMSIGDSRVDICRINGGTYAYEIKTEYDTFERLPNQLQDYSMAFEKVYVIVPKTRVTDVKKIIPSTCGIISYRVDENKQFIFHFAKRAEKNHCDFSICLKNLSSNDMSYLLRLFESDDYRTRAEKLNKLIEISKDEKIWQHYRLLLKHKYEKQWQFLLEHFEEILPIDIQTFFSSNIDPSIFYMKQK